MKKTAVLTLTLGLFILTLALAASQGWGYLQPDSETLKSLPAAIGVVYSSSMGIFSALFNGMVSLLGQSLFWSVITLAFLVEILLLYPSIAIQLKQKKIHLFHKKLVDRFNSGYLAVSKSKQELNVLYAVNEKLHRRGALLFVVQLLVFFWVIVGLQQLTINRPESWSALSRFDLSLLATPSHFLLPFSVALAYFLHSVIKIQFKIKEDYLNPKQITLALCIGLLVGILVFSFSSAMPVLLSIYMIHLITLSTLRYSLVEAKAKDWGKIVHRELVNMLINTPTSISPFKKWRERWNHFGFVRHFNLHLLGEAASMSLVIAFVALSVYNFHPEDRKLLAGDLDINTINFSDIQTISFAKPNGTLTIYKPGTYTIESVYLTFTDPTDNGFISGTALENSPLILSATGITAGEASIDNKSIVIHSFPFTEFTVKITGNGVDSEDLTVTSANVCTDSFITAVEPKGGNLDLNDADVGTPARAQLENEDLIPGNIFRFISDSPYDNDPLPPGAADFITEVRLVNTPEVLNMQARLLQENAGHVIIEVGAVEDGLTTTRSNFVYAFNTLFDNKTYLNAFGDADGVLLISEEFGVHANNYICQLNDTSYPTIGFCFTEGADGLYGFETAQTLDGPLEVGQSYPVVVNPQGGDYTWKVTNESIAKVQALSEAEDTDVNATINYIPTPLASDPQVSIPFGQFSLLNCVLDENNIKTECTLLVNLAIEYDDDGTHEASITANGEALENASLSSNGFSGVLTGTTKVYRNDGFTINLSGKVSGNFSFTVDQGGYSGGGGGAVESAITATVNGDLTEITEANIKTQFSLDLGDPGAFTEGNLVKTGEFTIDLEKESQGGSNSLAILETLMPGSVTVFAEDTSNQCLLAKTFEILEAEENIDPPQLSFLKRIGNTSILKGTLLNFSAKLSDVSNIALNNISIFLVKPSSSQFNTVQTIESDASAIWHELNVFFEQVSVTDQGTEIVPEEENVQVDPNIEEADSNFKIYQIPFQIPNSANIFDGNYWLYFSFTSIDGRETKAVYPVYIGNVSNVDVNGDGKKNMVDLILIFQIAVGNLIPSTSQFSAADVNKDNQVTIIDVILAYQNIFKS